MCHRTVADRRVHYLVRRIMPASRSCQHTHEEVNSSYAWYNLLGLTTLRSINSFRYNTNRHAMYRFQFAVCMHDDLCFHRGGDATSRVEDEVDRSVTRLRILADRLHLNRRMCRICLEYPHCRSVAGSDNETGLEAQVRVVVFNSVEHNFLWNQRIMRFNRRRYRQR